MIEVIVNTGDTTPTIIGIEGATGDRGYEGWSPLLAVVNDDEKRVFQITDWVGGGGTKPDTGDYIGETGLVADIADAVDIRGATGAGGFNVAIIVADITARKTLATYTGLGITPYIGMRVVQTDQFIGGLPTIEWALEAVDVTNASSWMGRVLTNDAGNLVVDLRLADFTGITPPQYSIGHVSGDLRMGDGVTEGGISTFASATQAETDAGIITNKGVSPSVLRMRYNDTNDSLIIGDLTGNTRGAGSCDIQSKRKAVTQVASGTDSVALGSVVTATGTNNASIGTNAASYGFTSIPLISIFILIL